MSSASFVKIGKRRIHQERAQPRARSKFGLLEKHGDYVARARDYNRKQDQLRHLREIASFRNPDEFYFAMIGSETVNGHHVAKRRIDPESRTASALKRFTAQDLVYLQTKAQEERCRIHRLQSSLHLLHRKQPVNTHTIYVDGDLDEFDAARHFDTLPQFVAQASYRPRLSQLATTTLSDSVPDAGARLRQYRMLSARLDRLDFMEKEIRACQLRQNLMGRGRAKKLPGPKDKFGEEDKSASPVYVWSTERKR